MKLLNKNKNPTSEIKYFDELRKIDKDKEKSYQGKTSKAN